MTRWAEFIGLWWAEFLLSSACLLLVTWIAMLLVRQPRYRMIWFRGTALALVILSALPAWSNRPALPLGFSLQFDPLSPADAPTVYLRPNNEAESSAPAARSGVQSSENTAAASVPVSKKVVAYQTSWPVYLGGTLLAGAILIGLRLLFGLWQVRVLERTAEKAPDTWQTLLAEVANPQQRLPQLLINHHGNEALAFGVFHPAILLPGRYLGAASVRAKAVMAHELAHIEHGDLWLRGLTRWLLPVLFPNPLFWWLRRRIHECQELLADAVAGERVGRRALATELNRMARIAVESGQGPLVSLGLSMAAKPSQFYLRVKRLLDKTDPVETHCPPKIRLTGVLACAACTVLCAALPFRPVNSRERNLESAFRSSRISDWTFSNSRNDSSGTALQSAELIANGSLLLPGRFEGTEEPDSFRVTVTEPGPVSIFIIPIDERIHPMIRAEWTTASGQIDSDSDFGGGSRRGDRPMLLIPEVSAPPSNHILISAQAREYGPTFSAGDYLLHIRHGRLALDLDPENIGVEASPILLNRNGEGYLSHDPLDGKRGPAIDFPGDVDVFQIVAARSGPITFAVRGDAGLRLWLRMICTSPRHEAEDGGGGIAGASRVTRETHEGTLFYLVVVAADGSSTGPYSVQISQ